MKTDISSLSLPGIVNSSDSFYLQSNAAWSISFSPSTPSWIGVNATSGTGNKRIIVKVLEQNNTGSNRTVTMNIVSSTGNANATLTITQRVTEVLAITNISPDHGPANTTVTITGTGFSPTSALNNVYFNGVEATIISVTITSILAKVPVGAGTGNVSVKLNGITVNGPLFTYEPSTVATVIAGSGFVGSANGVGTNASFALPTGLAIDASGNIYIADLAGATIRKVTTPGVVTTLAGKYQVYGNVNGTGSNALFDYVYDVATDVAGNVYAADFDNNNVRKITPEGVVTTFLSSGVIQPTGIAVDAQGFIYLASPSITAVRKISPAGLITDLGSTGSFRDIYDVTLDNAGNMYVCDRGTQLISKITPSGTVTTVAGVWNVSGFNNGPGATATFHNPSSIAVDNNGNIYIADVKNNAIRKINAAGIVTTYLANVSSYTVDANFFGPYGVAVDSNGVVFVTNTSENKLLKITEQ
ncbi:MAG TPA: IPT/TIG domain-containing protein [Chitinophagaceae bacterium]